MSGGRFNYLDGRLASEMFNYLSPSYGKSGFGLADQATVLRLIPPRLTRENLSSWGWKRIHMTWFLQLLNH